MPLCAMPHGCDDVTDVGSGNEANEVHATRALTILVIQLHPTVDYIVYLARLIPHRSLQL